MRPLQRDGRHAQDGRDTDGAGAVGLLPWQGLAPGDGGSRGQAQPADEVLFGGEGGQVIEDIEHAQLLHTVSGVSGRIEINQPNRLLDRSQTELEYLVMCQLRCIEDALLQHRGHVGKVLALLACIVRRGCQGLSQAQIAVAHLQQHRATIGTALQAAGSQPLQR